MDQHAPGEARHPALPHLQLDELLDGLVARVAQIRASRDRIQQLLQGVLAVSGGLDLDQVLATVIETATELVDARYGALGVTGEDHADRLERFVTVGLSPQEIAEIGPYPTRQGLLGRLIRHPQALRLADMADHEVSVGFPDSHPPTRTFLEVPIRVREEVYGNLYLTGKRGGAPFDADDEALLATLATAAGVAVDNARLYDDSRRRQQWSDATAELTRGLLSGVDVTAVLTVFIERIAAMAGAAAAMIFLPDGTGTTLSTRVAGGTGAERLQAVVLPVDGSVCGRVFQSAVGQFGPGGAPGAHVVCTEADPGSSYVAPMGTEPGQVHGVLVVVGHPGASPFGSQAVRMIIDVAAQATVALELAARRADAEQLVVFADRDRIGRDLHDQAIQRLFAAGMTLQTVLKITEKTAVRDRVSHVVGDLDDTIKVIRSTIFGLQQHESAGLRGGLRTQILQVCQDSIELLGFTPAVRFTGPIDYQVPEQAAEHAVAVTREALSNTARHSGASRVAVDLETGDGLLRLRITDDGVGLSDDSRRSGLANMEDRARDLGGTFTAGPGENGGTEIRWEVPLD